MALFPCHGRSDLITWHLPCHNNELSKKHFILAKPITPCGISHQRHKASFQWSKGQHCTNGKTGSRNGETPQWVDHSVGALNGHEERFLDRRKQVLFRQIIGCTASLMLMDGTTPPDVSDFLSRQSAWLKQEFEKNPSKLHPRAKKDRRTPYK